MNPATVNLFPQAPYILWRACFRCPPLQVTKGFGKRAQTLPHRDRSGSNFTFTHGKVPTTGVKDVSRHGVKPVVARSELPAIGELTGEDCTTVHMTKCQLPGCQNEVTFSTQQAGAEAVMETRIRAAARG